MPILIKSISAISNYKFYNDDEEYFLTFLSKSSNGTLLQYTHVSDVDNIKSGILGNTINKSFSMESIVLINFFKYSKSQRKLTLLFTSFANEPLKSNKIVLYGIQKHLILSQPIKNDDFVLEMFTTDFVTKDVNKMVINISCVGNNDQSCNKIIINPNKLSSPIYHNKMGIVFEEMSKYKHKLYAKDSDKDIHLNTFLSPVTGILQFFNNSDKTWLNNGSKRINIPNLIKMNIDNFEKGSSFIGINKTNHVYIPFDGFINRIIKYNNTTVFRISNEYYISDNSKSKFQWNYSQDNALSLNRENPAIIAKQEDYELEYHIVVFGKIEFGNNILKSIYSTLKANESYNIRPVFLQRGKYLLKVTDGNNIYVCVNRKIDNIGCDFGIKSFYEIHEEIGEVI